MTKLERSPGAADVQLYVVPLIGTAPICTVSPEQSTASEPASVSEPYEVQILAMVTA